ncbi:unnamed protein product, partial [Polarella glacialis]
AAAARVAEEAAAARVAEEAAAAEAAAAARDAEEAAAFAAAARVAVRAEEAAAARVAAEVAAAWAAAEVAAARDEADDMACEGNFAATDRRSEAANRSESRAFSASQAPCCDEPPFAAAAAADEWPEAAELAPPKPAAMTEAGAAWSQARGQPVLGFAEASAATASASSTSPAKGALKESAGLDQTAEAEAAGGIRRFIAELSRQLAEEVRRRESEEAELERRAAEKKRLLEELEVQRRRRESLTAEQRNDEAAALEIERQHAELAEEHRKLRAEVARQEAELEQLREEAKARNGAGRDWARDGPEKDALVETKLRVAEAHDELAQLRQQLWLNREGLRKKLVDLKAENARLRSR